MRTGDRSINAGLLLAGVFIALSIAGAGCKPDYPSCETDKDCKPKEVCVDRKCAQCRTSNDCPEGYDCNKGRCAPGPGYCQDKSQCKAGEECLAHRCRPCANDGECPSGLRCHMGECKKPQCKTDDDCAQDQDCVDGFCVSAKPQPSGAAPCPLGAVYFGFNESQLAGEASSTLTANAECLKKSPRPVNLVGRADPRGTVEYNLALGDRRAQSVKEYLLRLGVDANRLRILPRGALDATGTDEATWAKDRRVDSEWQ
jgi:peptidoglycan-associated lipoprotein